MSIPPIDNDHPGDWHRDKFVRFAQAKDVIGEPTPHMRVVMHMCKGISDIERMWRGGCYLTAYSVLTGEAIWREWSWERVTREPEKLLPWLEAHWGGVHTRKPRRCVRTPETFTKSLLGYADWIDEAVPDLRRSKYKDPREAYDTWWQSAQQIPYFGRYVIIRLLELYRRWGYVKADLYDIRAVGAHSPIRCLMLLEPESVPDLLTGSAAKVDAIAERVKADLEHESGVDFSYFIYATLLCEYRACYEDGGDYAGNQHDEELEYSLGKYARFWEDKGFMSDLYAARAAIDPHECLGEIQGWENRRLDVAKWMRARGIVWDDLQYDYLKSKAQDKLVLRKANGARKS